jgi:hypothetical protein
MTAIDIRLALGGVSSGSRDQKACTANLKLGKKVPTYPAGTAHCAVNVVTRMHDKQRFRTGMKVD